jgi:hypothetical protein
MCVKLRYVFRLETRPYADKSFELIGYRELNVKTLVVDDVFALARNIAKSDC